MDWGFCIPCLAAILGGTCVFAFSPRLHNFQKFVGFTFIFEGLTFLLGGSLFAQGNAFFLPSYLLYLAMMLVTPFFYYSATKYLLKESGVKSFDFWMLAVAAVYVISCAVAVSAIPLSERSQFFSALQGNAAGKLSVGARVMLAQDAFAYVVCFVENLFILIFCIVSFFKYRNLLARYYSNFDGARSAQVIVIVVALRFALMVASLFSDAGNPQWLSVMRAVLMVLFYGVAAAYVCRIRQSAEELSIMLDAGDSECQSQGKTPAADEVISERISILVEEKFFLNPDVNLLDISSQIHVNTKYVSDFLKYHYNESFMVYVNRLRVEHSKLLLAEGNASIADIAERSGYVSVSTYFRNFTKYCGISPSEYRENEKLSGK